MNPLSSHPVTPTESPSAVYPFPRQSFSSSSRPSVEYKPRTLERKPLPQRSASSYTPALVEGKAEPVAVQTTTPLLQSNLPKAADYYHRHERRPSFARRILGLRSKSSSACLQVTQHVHYVPSGTDNTTYTASPPSPATSALLSPSPGSSAYASSRASVDQPHANPYNVPRALPKSSLSPLRRSYSSSDYDALANRGRASATFARPNTPAAYTARPSLDGEPRGRASATITRASVLRNKSMDWFGFGMQLRRRKSGSWWGTVNADADAEDAEARAPLNSAAARQSFDQTRPQSRLEEAIVLDMYDEIEDELPRGRNRAAKPRLPVLSEIGEGLTLGRIGKLERLSGEQMFAHVQ